VLPALHINLELHEKSCYSLITAAGNTNQTAAAAAAVTIKSLVVVVVAHFNMEFHSALTNLICCAQFCVSSRLNIKRGN